MKFSENWEELRWLNASRDDFNAILIVEMGFATAKWSPERRDKLSEAETVTAILCRNSVNYERTIVEKDLKWVWKRIVGQLTVRIRGMECWLMTQCKTGTGNRGRGKLVWIMVVTMVTKPCQRHFPSITFHKNTKEIGVPVIFTEINLVMLINDNKWVKIQAIHSNDFLGDPNSFQTV